MSLVKSFANAIRIRTGQTPLVVTTSSAMGEITTTSPLVEMFTKRDSSMTERLPCRFIATATEGLRKPEQQLWNIDVNIDNGRFNEPVRIGVTYDKMLAFMKATELRAAQEAGVTGTDDEIIAKRKPVVARNNILNFVK